jgi:hypothetical protein
MTEKIEFKETSSFVSRAAEPPKVPTEHDSADSCGVIFIAMSVHQG